MIPLKEIHYNPIIRDVKAILAGDLGGTNSNFGVFVNVNDRFLLLLSLHAKSQQVASFTDLVRQVVTYLKDTYAITITDICLAAAGPVNAERTFIKPTNLAIPVDAAEIMKVLNNVRVYLANDFEVIGYGLPYIDPKAIVAVTNVAPRAYACKAIIGAGTGLGKCILYWSNASKSYLPIASEGGHADFPAQSQRELDLVKYIQKYENWYNSISWEDVISGNGIQRIYHFLRNAEHNHPIAKETHAHGPQPDEIFKSRVLDDYCKETFAWYTTFYARCAKDFALETLALAGIYIAGGIAAKNLELFELPAFKNEFLADGKMSNLVAQIPVFVITDYNVSLYGAAHYILAKSA
jgi:glucokinase